MKPHRVVIIKTIQQELAIEQIYADSAREAEQLALDMVPEDSRGWTETHREVVGRVEARP